MRKVELTSIHGNYKKKVICLNKCDNFVGLKCKFHESIDAESKLLVIFSDCNASCVINNNDFIPENKTKFYYDILKEPSDDVIIQFKKNYFNIPKYIQIPKYESIKQLKAILNHTNSNLKIFLFDSDRKLLLDDNKSIEESGLSDFSKLSVWRGNNLNVELEICNPLIKLNEQISSQTICILNCTVTDSVEKVKKDISNRMNSNKEMNLALYSELSNLDNGKFLLNYPIRNSNNNIYFVDLIKTEAIDQNENVMREREGFKMFKGEMKSTNSAVIINKYKTKNIKAVDRKSLKYEIITHLKLTTCRKSLFVGLISLFQTKSYFNIVVEFMEEGSLKELYSSRELSTNEILNYSHQILEALSFMHDNFIIHRGVKCSSVLLHENKRKVKLTNFRYSKYLFNNTFDEMITGLKGSEHATDSDIYWIAPEVLKEELYGLKADIWSLGATIIEMLTRLIPYADMNPLRAKREIIDRNNIIYDLTLNPIINILVEKCIVGEQSDRPVASDLMNDSIFNNISSNQTDYR